MKFVKGISLFFVYPVIMLGIGFFAGVQMTHFFYPGNQENEAQVTEPAIDLDDYSVAEEQGAISPSEDVHNVVSDETANSTGVGMSGVELSVTEVSSSMETLSVDTEYVLEETDIVTGSVVETVWKLPDKYIGLNREQFLEAMESYEAYPPLAEMERGFVNLEVLSFSRERVVVKMNYQYIQPSTSFYLAVRDNEVIVYLEDMETIYINTGIDATALPEDVQMELMQMIWVEDEESLYNFLEAYSS